MCIGRIFGSRGDEGVARPERGSWGVVVVVVDGDGFDATKLLQVKFEVWRVA